MEITVQEMFDSQCEFGTGLIGVLNAMQKVQMEYDHETGNRKFSDSYYKKLKEIADEFDLKYTEPKFRRGLTGVGTTTNTIH